MSEVINGVPRELLERIACEVTPKTNQELFDSAKDFAAAIKELRALLNAQPQASVCETMGRPKAECGCPDCGSSLIDWPQASAAQSAPVIDLDANAWESIKEAASESPWIPAQYFMGDWVADVCEFLRSGRAAQSAPAGEREALWQLIHDTLRNYRMSTLDDGYGGGYPLIDAMTADGQPVSGGIEECTYLADAIWNALLAAAPAQPAAQDYVIVPVDPTPKMLVAYMETDGAVKRWKAMVAAAKAEGVHV